MATPRDSKRLSAALTLGVALGLPAATHAQSPGISSGSGSGTGTGSSAGTGLGTTGTGTSAGSGLGTTGTGSESAAGTRVPNLMNGGRDGGMGGARGGRGVPLETLINSDGRPMAGVEVTKEEVTAIDARLLSQARLITDPGQRAVALERVARNKIFGNKLGDAHIALVEAAQAAVQENSSANLHDRRTGFVMLAILALADADLREGLLPRAAEIDDTEIAPPPEESPVDRRVYLNNAQDEWDRARALALQFRNADLRGQMLSRISESEATGAQQMADAAANERPDPSERDRDQDPLVARANRLFKHSASNAARITMPVWRDHALEAIVAKAAASGQFTSGLEIARMVGRPEIRVAAFLHVAEAQARRDLQRDATSAYEEAARAVASINLEDPRMVLGGILIDSLISTGRFDDARASISLLPSVSRRRTALGAIAESQGRRGLADSAMAWIEREPDSEVRSMLRRRVSDGMLATVEQYRTNVLSNERAR